MTLSPCSRLQAPKTESPMMRRRRARKGESPSRQIFLKVRKSFSHMLGDVPRCLLLLAALLQRRTLRCWRTWRGRRSLAWVYGDLQSSWAPRRPAPQSWSRISLSETIWTGNPLLMVMLCFAVLLRVWSSLWLMRPNGDGVLHSPGIHAGSQEDKLETRWLLSGFSVTEGVT